MKQRTASRGSAAKKIAVAALALGGLSVLAWRLRSQIDSIDWEARFEAMPDNAPPKWMFRNIRAIRENTDRILEIQKASESPPAPSSATLMTAPAT